MGYISKKVAAYGQFVLVYMNTTVLLPVSAANQYASARPRSRLSPA